MAREIFLKSLVMLHRQKYSLLKDMHKATTVGSILDAPERADEILEYVQSRDEYIEKINILDKQIQKTIEGLNGLISSNTDYDALSGIFGEIKKIEDDQEKLLKEMLEMDKMHGGKIEQSIKKIMLIKKDITVGRQTLKAYIERTTLPGSAFIDEKK